VTESGEKDGEEDMKKEKGTISKKGSMDEVEGEEDTAIRIKVWVTRHYQINY
jgi:hypothetical protein